MRILNYFFNKRGQSKQAQMAFVDHIEELRWHIIRAILAILIASAYCFFNIEWIFTNIILGPTQNDFISYQYLNKLGALLHISALQLQDMSIQFQNTELSGQFMMSFSVSFMMGLILSFPFVFWELWKFIRPALKASELRYARGIVFWSSLLFFIGVLFAYYVIAPFTINFFANYQLSPQFKNIITITNYYDTMSDLIMGMGLVFELPVIVFMQLAGNQKIQIYQCFHHIINSIQRSCMLGTKPNQGIDRGLQIRFIPLNREIGGMNGPPVLAFGRPMGGDRAAFAQEPTGCAAC